MAEAKQLTKKELNSIKSRLVDRKGQLEEQLAELYKEKGLLEQSQDPGDYAQSLSLETLRTSLQDAEIEEYNMIQQAIKMIDAGTYGRCIDCEQPISEKRLESFPNATRCLICQEVVEERKQAVL